MKDKFEQMMALAEFGAKRNEEGRQLVFKMFVSYVTFLVVIAGLTMRYWDPDWNLSARRSWLVIGIVNILLLLMFFVYRRWLRAVYTGLIYNVRRRDFYLKKAEVICYHSSKKLACEVSSCEEISVNLGSTNRYEITEKSLFKKRAPDIKNQHASPPKKPVKGEPPAIKKDRFYQFNLLFPLFLTALNIATLMFMIFFAKEIQS